MTADPGDLHRRVFGESLLRMLMARGWSQNRLCQEIDPRMALMRPSSLTRLIQGRRTSLSETEILLFVRALEASEAEQQELFDTARRAGLLVIPLPYRLMLDHTVDLFWLLDSDGRIKWASPSNERTFGFTLAELFRMPPRFLIHPEDSDRTARALSASSQGNGSAFDVRMRHKDGRYLWVSCRTFRVQDEVGPCVWLVGRSIDSERRIAIEREHRHSRQRSLMTLLRHNQQEPLNCVSAAAKDLQETLAKAPLDSVRLRRVGDEIVEQAGVARQWAHAIAQFQAIDHGAPMTAVDLNDAFEAARHGMADKLIAQDARITATTLPTVYGDASQMRMMMAELIDNALKFGRRGAPPVIAVSARELDHEMWRIDVCDNGLGIPEDDHLRIFEVAYRCPDAHCAGLGMGLAIGKSIAMRHNGVIAVGRSRPGVGTTIYFTVARWDSPGSAAAMADPTLQ